MSIKTPKKILLLTLFVISTLPVSWIFAHHPYNLTIQSVSLITPLIIKFIFLNKNFFTMIISLEFISCGIFFILTSKSDPSLQTLFILYLVMNVSEASFSLAIMIFCTRHSSEFNLNLTP